MFRLLRYFSLGSAGVIVVVISLLMVFFHHLSVEDLVNVGQRQNEILARAIDNHIWNRFGPYLSSIKEADGETILIRARTREISEEPSPLLSPHCATGADSTRTSTGRSGAHRRRRDGMPHAQHAI